MSAVPASYCDRLRLMVTGGDVEEALTAWAAERRDPVGRWRRVHGRLRPGRSPWAVLVYQADGGPTVQVGMFEPSDARAGGTIEITPCQDDPALPGLRAVLAALDDAAIVRYSPGHRCTVRGGLGSEVRYVKVLYGEVDDQREARARREAVASAALSFNVAEPYGWDERTRASWYGVVPGRAVVPALLGPDGRELAERMGRALGELAVAPLRPDRTWTPADQLMRTKRALGRGAAAAPTLGDVLLRAADALTRAHAGLGERPLVPVHGAVHLANWLVDDNGRLGMVDFDRWARGEPEFDLATLFVDLESHFPTASTGGLEQAALRGFRAVAGEPDQGRLVLYAAHRRLARVARTAFAVRPDAEERAALQLQMLQPSLAMLVG